MTAPASAHDGAYDRAPCGLLATTADGTVVEVNATFLATTGHRRDDLVGRRRFVDLLTPGGQIYHETHFMPLLRLQGRAREIAFEVVRADGGRTPVLVNAVLDADADDGAGRMHVAVFDATERRSYERELLAAKQRAEESESRARLLARTLQETLIPPAVPVVPGLDVAAAYHPAGKGVEVGGDFYDVFQIGPGDWVVAVGDVAGKGVPAAVVTAVARHTIRAAAVTHPDPHEVLGTLHEVLLQDAHQRFCTVVLVRLRQSGRSWRATIGTGGHPPALLVRPDEPPRPVGRPGTILGAMRLARLHDEDVDLDPGDALFLYTDGVTEARRGGEWFGDAGLAASIGEADRSTAAGLVDRVVADVLAFQSGYARDDVAVVAVRVPGDPTGTPVG